MEEVKVEVEVEEGEEIGCDFQYPITFVKVEQCEPCSEVEDEQQWETKAFKQEIKEETEEESIETHQKPHHKKPNKKDRSSWTDEEKEKMYRAYQRHRWATASDEEKEKRRIYMREYHKKRKVSNAMKETEKERRKLYHREYYRQRISGKMKKVRAILTDEQKEKAYRAYQRQRWAAATDEEKEKKKAYMREYRKKRRVSDKLKKVEQFGSENIILPQCPVKLEQEEIDNRSNFTNGCLKSSVTIDGKCATITTVKVEECSSQSGELDRFEECEDWKTHIKTERIDTE